jgi:predicted RNA-binding protein with TRAM domain
MLAAEVASGFTVLSDDVHVGDEVIVEHNAR